MNSILLIYVLANSYQDAITLTVNLLENRIIACAHIIEDTTSFYWWKNRIAKGDEVVLICKTIPALQEKVVQYIQKGQGSIAPAIISLQAQVNEKYYAWIDRTINVQ